MRLRLVLSRMAGIVMTIFVIATINFVLVRTAPGDPAAVIAGQSGATDEKFLQQVRAEYGLDKPYVQQLGSYLWKVATLDLGYSYRLRRSVKDLIGERLGPTLLLTLSAFLLSLMGGVIFGALAGIRHGKLSDLAISLMALILYATPVFWLGLMLVLLFSIQLDWLPAFGYSNIRAGQLGTVGYALDVLKHLCLPAITLGAIYMAVYARLMRASVIEVAAEDYIKTARAKGLTEGAILRGHMLRNASLPVITFAGLQIGAMMGGAVVVETVFAWPGLGRLTFDAVSSRDYPVLLGLFLVMSVLVIGVNLLTDLIHRLVDPAWQSGDTMNDIVRTFFRRPAGMLGVAIMSVVVLAAALAPVFYPDSPWDMAGTPLQGPGTPGALLGTDTMGRDIAAGIMHGARISLMIGIASTAAALLLGVTLGAIAGIAGETADHMIVRFIEIFQTIPNFVLAILLVAILTPSIWTIILAIGLVSWPPLARLTRIQVKSIAAREFVHAARCQGQGAFAVLLRHIIPNAISPIIVTGSMAVASAILIEAALSFMGLGDPNYMSWGYMIGAGRTVIRQAWWASVFPGLAILLTAVAINLIGEALNDALNPRIARS